MSLLKETMLLLRKHRVFPRKSLGQHFMIEPSFLRQMISQAFLDKTDTVLDAGAGIGFLALLMAEKSKTVLAVETDARLANILREKVKCIANIRIIEGDVLRVEIPPFNKVVSIPPYNISSHFLHWLFRKGFDRAVIILQKEFADHLVASVGSENYGWITVITYYYAEVELLEEIPKSMFFPPPKINSIITCLTPKRPRPFTLLAETQFKGLLQSLFRQRNRKVRNAVVSYLKGARVMSKEEMEGIASSIPFRDQRVRELDPEDFGVLSNLLNK